MQCWDNLDMQAVYKAFVRGHLTFSICTWELQPMQSPPLVGIVEENSPRMSAGCTLSTEDFMQTSWCIARCTSFCIHLPFPPPPKKKSVSVLNSFSFETRTANSAQHLFSIYISYLSTPKGTIHSCPPMWVLNIILPITTSGMKKLTFVNSALNPPWQ